MTLLDMSAFSYEDYLQSLKQLVCGKKVPLVQMVKRLNEIGNLDNKLLKKKHKSGPWWQR